MFIDFPAFMLHAKVATRTSLTARAWTTAPQLVARPAETLERPALMQPGVLSKDVWGY